MLERSRREGLDRYSRVSKRPRLSQFRQDRRRIVASAGCLKKSTRSFQNFVRGGPSECREVCRHYAILRSLAGVKRLGHSAEVLAQSCAFARRNAQGGENMRQIEAIQLRDSGGRAHDTDGACRMKAFFVMPR